MKPQQPTKPATPPDKPSPVPRALRDAARKGYLRITDFTNHDGLDDWMRQCARSGLPAIILSRSRPGQWPPSSEASVQIIYWTASDIECSELAQLRGAKEVHAFPWGTSLWAQDRHSARIARELAQRFGTAGGKVRLDCGESAPSPNPSATQEARNA